jgi:hypothetical protein
MRTCVSCGDQISEKKRKDAKYCDKPGCRGREYRKRQAEAQAAEGKAHAHATSAVLACACGRRYRIQISALDGPEVAADPALSLPEPPMTALTETVSPTTRLATDTGGEAWRAGEVSQALTETVSPTTQPAPDTGGEAGRVGEVAKAFTETVSPTALPAPAADNGPELETAASGAITQAVLRTDQRSDQSPAPATAPMSTAQALTQTDRGAALPSGLVTLELQFVRGSKQRIPLERAVQRRSGGRFALQPETRAVFSMGDGQRSSLGGRPGAWAHVYGERSPVEYGYDADLVVMFWDHSERRGRVAKTSLLRDILGAGWKARLREQAGRT